MYRHKLLFLVAFTVFLAISISVSALTTSPPSGHRDYSPRMECNSNNCLLTWLRAAPSNTVDVYYQLLDSKANPTGNEGVLATGVKAAGNYVVAGADSFFVFWIEQANEVDGDFDYEYYRGRLIDTKSGIAVPKSTTNFGFARWREGQIIGAYDSALNRYLVAYGTVDTVYSTSAYDISVAIIDAQIGNYINSQRYLVSGDEIPSSIIFDPNSKHYILAYFAYTGSSPFFGWNLKIAAIDMFGNRALKPGTQTPVEANIAGANWGGSVGPTDTQLTRIPADNKVVIVFPKSGGLFSQYVIPTISSGKIIDFSVYPQTQTLTTIPTSRLAAAYNQKNNNILAVWYKFEAPVGIYSRLLDIAGTGQTVEQKIQITVNDSAFSYPVGSLVFNSDMSRFILPFATQNKVATVYLSAAGSVATTSKFTAPTSTTVKKFTPKDSLTNTPVADGSQNSNNLAITFVNETEGPKLVVNALFANGDVSMVDIKIEANNTATAVDLSTATNVDNTHQIFVPNANGGQGVRVCPAAKTLSQIVAGCANEVLLKTVPGEQNGISVAFTQFKTAQDTYVISGLTGSGAGLYFAPGTSPSPTPSPSSGLQTKANLTTEHTANNNTIDFTATYTDNSTGIVIPNPYCKIEFSDIDGGFNMTYTPVSGGGGLNKYSRAFTATASGIYRVVTCSKTGFTTEVANKTFSIQVAGVDNPPTDVNAISPLDDRVYNNTGDVEFICSAKDDHFLNSIKLVTDIPNAEKSNLVSGTSNSTTWTVRAIPKGTYKWSCEAEDGSGKKKESAKRTLIINFTSTGASSCTEDWACAPESFDSIACQADGTKKRACVDKNNCNNAVPVVPKPDTQKCIPATGASCQEDWDCRPVGSCTNNKQSLACTDKNNCSNPTPVVEKPKSKACGAASGTSGGDGLFSNPIVLVLIIAIPMVLVLFLIIRKKRRASADESGEEDQNSEKYGDDSELRGGYEEGGEAGEGEYQGEPGDENQDDQGGSEDEEER